MSDFRFQPWPGTIAITAFFAFRSWLIREVQEVKHNANFYRSWEQTGKGDPARAVHIGLDMQRGAAIWRRDAGLFSSRTSPQT